MRTLEDLIAFLERIKGESLLVSNCEHNVGGDVPPSCECATDLLEELDAAIEYALNLDGSLRDVAQAYSELKRNL